MFFGCNAPPDYKMTKLGSCDKETSPLISKTTGVVLELCRPWKYVAISSRVAISICLTTDEFSGRVKKIVQGWVPHSPVTHVSHFTTLFNLYHQK